MLQDATEILIKARQRLANNLKELTPDQWFTQPEGFANNIAWNVGHLVVAQQFLCYRRVNAPTQLSEEMIAEMHKLYGNGTSPADWSENPDTDVLLHLLVEIPQKMSKDVAAGKFDNLVMPQPADSSPQTMMHIMMFNHFHEGFHAGTIGDLLGHLRENE